MRDLFSTTIHTQVGAQLGSPAYEAVVSSYFAAPFTISQGAHSQSSSNQNAKSNLGYRAKERKSVYKP